MPLSFVGSLMLALQRTHKRLIWVAHLADAVAHPGAMVVEFAGAVVADGAVRAPRGPVVVACHAPFGVDGVPVDLVFLAGRPVPAASNNHA